jgi:hypothetical protein
VERLGRSRRGDDGGALDAIEAARVPAAAEALS